MKKLNLGNINAGLNSLKAATDNAAQNGRFELIDTTLIDFAAKNSYAADDNEESYKELAANIDEVGLLTPLGVIVNGNRYTLFSGERRFRAITTYLHWTKVPCYVFETKSVRKAQLMLHQANASREYTPQRKLQLYEEYRELLEEMKEAGEIKGGMQEHLAKLMGVSERSVRYYKQRLQASKNTEPYRFFIIGLVMIFGSYAMYIPVLLERIARGIMDKVSIKNDLELINSKFGTSYTASDYMYGKGHIKQIVTYISIGEESIAELISNPKLSDAKRTVILDLLSRGLTVDQIKPYIQSDDPYTAEQLQFELYKLFFTQIGIVNSRNITK